MLLFLLMLAPLKEEISSLEMQIQTAPTSSLYFNLAKAHLKDQEVDRAFLAFLDALDQTERKEGLEMPKDALTAYFQGNLPIELKPDDLAHNFIASISLANQGHFDLFFDHFFAGYPYFKGSFLDFKIRGIIYLRLSQKAVEKREFYLTEAQKNLRKALALECNDASLYRSLILLAKDAKKEEDILFYLEKLAKSEAHFLRQDILFYVQEAMMLGRREIAEVVVEKGKQLYSYSRSIEAAEKILGSK